MPLSAYSDTFACPAHPHVLLRASEKPPHIQDVAHSPSRRFRQPPRPRSPSRSIRKPALTSLIAPAQPTAIPIALPNLVPPPTAPRRRLFSHAPCQPPTTLYLPTVPGGQIPTSVSSHPNREHAVRSSPALPCVLFAAPIFPPIP